MASRRFSSLVEAQTNCYITGAKRSRLSLDRLLFVDVSI